jgi:heme-degrading monooxygenase HmoA
MAATIVQQKVPDYATWRKQFDSLKDLRKTSGVLSDQIFRDARDPNRVMIVLKWDSITHAEKFYNSPELKSALVKAGAEGTIISYLNEA